MAKRRRCFRLRLEAFILALLISRGCSFSTTTRRRFSPASSALFGFRSSMRKTWSSLKKRNILESIAPIRSLPDYGVLNSSTSGRVAIESTTINLISSVSVLEPEDVSVLEPNDSIGLSELKAVPVDSDSPIYSLPLIGDRNLTKLELEFRNMLGDFAHFTPHDIESLRDPRMRVLFEGVAASAGCGPVYRAFEVLYEDLYPLRVAGRMVYGRLRQLMMDSQRERDEEVELIVGKHGLARSEVEATRLAFVSVAARLNGDSFLTKDQLRETGLANTAMHILGFESVDNLLEHLGDDSSDKITFTNMMIGLQATAENICGIERCNPAEVMQEIMLELKAHPPTARTKLDARRQQYSEQYDSMLSAFKEWEDLMPQGSGRRLDVVRGCFVGAKNKHVVEALRVVYVDYAALRVAGDLIFKLVKGVMSVAAKRRKV